MKKSFSYLPLALALMGGMAACQRSGDAIRLEPLGDSLTVVRVDNPARYLLLPIQESSPEGLVKLDKGDPADVAMDVRLAVDSVDYYVPFELSATDGEAKVVIDGVPFWRFPIRSIRVIPISIARFITIRRFMAG